MLKFVSLLAISLTALAAAYAIAVRHDVNGDNSKGDWSDGGGFSNNPSLSLLHLKPSLRQTAVNVGNGVKPVSITLLYRHGFSIGPAGQD
jgi:uncharacterized protein (DUF2141 family)